MRNQAIAVFHRSPENYNCAQAVLAACQACTGRETAKIADYKAFGGGRAPGNECGALFAACQAAPASAATLRAAFAQTAGSTHCLELKRRLKYPCTECVGLAAALLQKHISTANPSAP